jgi:hypothetical protein
MLESVPRRTHRGEEQQMKPVSINTHKTEIAVGVGDSNGSSVWVLAQNARASLHDSISPAQALALSRALAEAAHEVLDRADRVLNRREAA